MKRTTAGNTPAHPLLTVYPRVSDAAPHLVHAASQLLAPGALQPPRPHSLATCPLGELPAGPGDVCAPAPSLQLQRPVVRRKLAHKLAHPLLLRVQALGPVPPVHLLWRQPEQAHQHLRVCGVLVCLRLKFVGQHGPAGPPAAACTHARRRGQWRGWHFCWPERRVARCQAGQNVPARTGPQCVPAVAAAWRPTPAGCAR